LRRERATEGSVYKRRFVFGIVTFFAFTFLLIFINFSDGGITGKSIFNIFDFAGENADSLIITKYIFFLTLAGIIYWGASSLVGESNGGFFVAVGSLGVSYVSIAFILPDQIISIISVYSALGVTFTIFLPFIAVLLVTSKLVTSVLTVQKILVQRVIWGAYSLLVVYYLWTTGNLWGTNETVIGGLAAAQGLSWMILIIFAVSAFFFIKNDPYVRLIRKYKGKVERANAEAERQERALASEQAEHDKNLKEYLGDGLAKERIRELNELRKGF